MDPFRVIGNNICVKIVNAGESAKTIDGVYGFSTKYWFQRFLLPTRRFFVADHRLRTDPPNVQFPYVLEPGYRVQVFLPEEHCPEEEGRKLYFGTHYAGKAAMVYSELDYPGPWYHRPWYQVREAVTTWAEKRK